MNVSVSEAAALLREADDILILSHRRRTATRPAARARCAAA